MTAVRGTYEGAILPVTWLLFLGYEFILSEANLSYEAKPSAINLPNLNINSYPKNMSPCNDFITYFFVDKINQPINQVCDKTISPTNIER